MNPDAFARLSSLLEYIDYIDGDYGDPATFTRLREALGDAKRPLHYLAIPPSMFVTVTKGLAASASARDARLVVEKPFGRDLASVRELNRVLRRSCCTAPGRRAATAPATCPRSASTSPATASPRCATTSRASVARPATGGPRRSTTAPPRPRSPSAARRRSPGRAREPSRAGARRPEAAPAEFSSSSRYLRESFTRLKREQARELEAAQGRTGQQRAISWPCRRGDCCIGRGRVRAVRLPT